MSRELVEKTVSVPIPNRLLWEIRCRYDPETVDNILRVIYCAQKKMRYDVLCVGSFLLFCLSVVMTLSLSGNPLSLCAVCITVALYVFARRKEMPYNRAIEVIVYSNPKQFNSVWEDLPVLERQFGKGVVILATVTVRL